jgi:hypothetical protein
MANEIRSLEGRGWLDMAAPGGNVTRFQSSGGRLKLDRLPPLNRSFVPERHWRDYEIFRHPDGSVKRTAQVMTHRGCKGRCAYCSERVAFGERGVDRILHEIAVMRSSFGIEAIFFDDSTFSDFGCMNALLSGLKTLELEWGCLCRFDSLSSGMIERMRRAGCSYIYFGLEQFDDEVLRQVRKGIPCSKVVDVLGVCSNLGIRVGLSCLFGIGETRTVAQRTLEQVGRWVSDGSVVLVSLSSMCVHPLSALSQGQSCDYDRFPPHWGYPWHCFEEGLWYHPSCLDEPAARWIVSLVREAIPPRALVRRELILGSQHPSAFVKLSVSPGLAGKAAEAAG